MSAVTPEVVAEHGLSEQEYGRILKILGRPPNFTELGIFSAMWSEHCSYKSSKVWLKTLPTEAPWVICGPGENAGVIDIGDGQAAVFKMESHNHPSFIEPYQGAATGVGGILRDVFTMGARPIANLNALRFGAPEHPKTRHLVAGVVAGIGGYGNCIGVPTVGGECEFDAAYDGNILVNAMTLGVADADKIFYSAAEGPGDLVIYAGSKTGRDGIHGASMASAEFSQDAEEKRPTVQVGDPFTEKLLLEACLELMAGDAIVAIQDMGAAGLTSSSFEMASKGGLGVELDLDQVPAREDGMTAYELMLSESQERMLMLIHPEREREVRAVFTKWELDCAVIGKTTDTGRMVLRMGGDIVAELPIDPLAEAAPVYERPWTPGSKPKALSADDVPAPNDPLDALKRLLGCPDLASKRWVWEQYDSSVMADTIQGPGGDAAVVRVHGTVKALALTSDCTPRYVAADAREGARQAVAEAWRNLTATGARPLAITDCLNFGNPEKPEIMGQFAEAVGGMGEACKALDFPVVSGNVSLYNETQGQAIPPTPVVGGVGLIDDAAKAVNVAFKDKGEAIVAIGVTAGHLGQSLYLREIAGRAEGPPPPVDLAAEKRNGDLVRKMIMDGLVTACHDVSDGGLAVALAEMALASGASGIGAEITAPEGIGAEITAPEGILLHAWLFGEDQGRYILTTADPDRVLAEAVAADIPAAVIGTTGGAELAIDGAGALSLAELAEPRESWMPRFMAGE